MVNISWKAWLALSIFTVQSGCTALILRYATSRLEPYSTAMAVFFMEWAVKLPLALVLYTIECGGPVSMASALVADVQTKPCEWIKLAVPSLVYTIQNNLMYVGFANVEAAVGQVICQSKIFWSAVFSVLLLGKRLSPNQWISLLVLAAGVVCVQSKGKAATGAVREQNVTLGVGALLVAMVCSSFASVYFEMMLKTAAKPSLWLRNIQMALWGGLIAAVGVSLVNDPNIAERGYLYNFGFWAWLCTVWQGAGGLLVAVTLKYADNILRNFAAGLAIIVAAIGSYAFFEFELNATFFGGSALVIGAAFLYGSPAQTPQELCPSLCGTRPSEEAASFRLLGSQEPDSPLDSPDSQSATSAPVPPWAASHALGRNSSVSEGEGAESDVEREGATRSHRGR